MSRKNRVKLAAGNGHGFVDSVRLRRNGDRFHYIWAATQLLRLLDAGSHLQAIAVEGTAALLMTALVELRLSTSQSTTGRTGTRTTRSSSGSSSTRQSTRTRTSACETSDRRCESSRSWI